MTVCNASFSKTLEDSRDFIPPKDERNRFHSFRDFAPARKGVDGLRSHSRGRDRRALMGVKLKMPSEFSGAGAVVSL